MVAVNDTRARPHVDMSTQPPAKRWSCRSCNVLGFKDSILQSTVYPGAVRYLEDTPKHRRLKKEWKKRFAGTPEMISAALDRYRIVCPYFHSIYMLLPYIDPS